MRTKGSHISKLAIIFKMTSRIILCDDIILAYQLTELMYHEECDRLGNKQPREERSKNYLLGVEENILTGQIGLHLSYDYVDKVDIKYLSNVQIRTPLWIDEKFINGEPFFALGIGPFGFGTVNPSQNRKILEGNFSKSIIEQARQSTRKYTIEVQNQAMSIINAYISRPAIRQKLIETIDPFKFEELVAELLIDKGFDIFLTPRTSDGGKDIIAAYSFDKEPIIMMVECKRRPIDFTLGPIELRALVGQFYYELIENSKINYAMLVTSAGKIGNTSVTMSEKLKDISIIDFEKLNNWLLNYGRVKNNLWLPETFGRTIQ